MKALFSVILALVLSTIVASTTYAAGSECQVVYGGGDVCPKNVSFTLNKLIQKNDKGAQFVENLTINDPKFTAGQTVNFRIDLKNTGSETIKKLDVSDKLPQHVTFVSGEGKFDNATRTITFSVENLAKDQSKSFKIVTKVVDATNLPADRNMICEANEIKGTTDGHTATDTTQFCIEKTNSAAPVAPAQNKPSVQTAPNMTQTPPTGPESLALLALIPAGTLGYYLKKASAKGLR